MSYRAIIGVLGMRVRRIGQHLGKRFLRVEAEGDAVICEPLRAGAHLEEDVVCG